MTIINWHSKPVSSLQGELQVPGDKSISHRSIILGAIAKGTTVVNNFLDGDDCLATIRAFQTMSVDIEGPSHKQVIIHGVGKYGLRKPAQPIDCGNSGTSMRLLAGLLAAQTFDSCLTGDNSLLQRPMLRVSKPLSQMGGIIHAQEDKPPLVISGNQPLKGIDYQMPVASAQVKSCLLLAGMYAQGQTRIHESAPSRDHTEKMLKTFSYPIVQDKNSILIQSQGECHGTEIQVPGDMSSAAFFIVAATIVPGSDLIIRNVGINPTRIGVLNILKQMGANITLLNQRSFGAEEVADIHVRYAPLVGITIDEALVPLAIDEFPILFIAAACATGETILHGAKELRLKESDRIGAMVNGLCNVGIVAEAYEDGAFIKGGSIKGGVVNSLGDHRVAMSFAIAGTLALHPIIINNCANVATSFPNFLKTANTIGCNIKDG